MRTSFQLKNKAIFDLSTEEEACWSKSMILSGGNFVSQPAGTVWRLSGCHSLGAGKASVVSRE